MYTRGPYGASDRLHVLDRLTQVIDFEHRFLDHLETKLSAMTATQSLEEKRDELLKFETSLRLETFFRNIRSTDVSLRPFIKSLLSTLETVPVSIATDTSDSNSTLIAASMPLLDKMVVSEPNPKSTLTLTSLLDKLLGTDSSVPGAPIDNVPGVHETQSIGGSVVPVTSTESAIPCTPLATSSIPLPVVPQPTSVPALDLTASSRNGIGSPYPPLWKRQMDAPMNTSELQTWKGKRGRGRVPLTTLHKIHREKESGSRPQLTTQSSALADITSTPALVVVPTAEDTIDSAIRDKAQWAYLAPSHTIPVPSAVVPNAVIDLTSTALDPSQPKPTTPSKKRKKPSTRPPVPLFRNPDISIESAKSDSSGSSATTMALAWNSKPTTRVTTLESMTQGVTPGEITTAATPLVNDNLPTRPNHSETIQIETPSATLFPILNDILQDFFNPKPWEKLLQTSPFSYLWHQCSGAPFAFRHQCELSIRLLISLTAGSATTRPPILLSTIGTVIRGCPFIRRTDIQSNVAMLNYMDITHAMKAGTPSHPEARQAMANIIQRHTGTSDEKAALTTMIENYSRGWASGSIIARAGTAKACIDMLFGFFQGRVIAETSVLRDAHSPGTLDHFDLALMGTFTKPTA